jgi:hypothetical protein
MGGGGLEGSWGVRKEMKDVYNFVVVDELRREKVYNAIRFLSYTGLRRPR